MVDVTPFSTLFPLYERMFGLIDHVDPLIRQYLIKQLGEFK